LVVALLVVVWLLWRRRSRIVWRTINVNGAERRYIIRASDLGARLKPLLLCFHGGGGRVEALARRSGLAESGHRHGFMVLFPEATEGWIDARAERGGSTADLDFVDGLLDALISGKQIDPSRVFAFGVSNGGLFVFRLASERRRRFVAFATAMANMPIAGLSAGQGPPAPIALTFGREDRVMPFQGGAIMRTPWLGVGGEVVSAQATLHFWLKRNRAEETPRRRHLTSAGHSVDIEDYLAGAGGAAVRYVTLGGWGHRWPSWGGALAPGESDFNAADLVTEFFAGLTSSTREPKTTAAAAGERSAHA
jgi:polyhydroxybutyrate depolymerase